jgi:tRNA G18 (ribose-2'-O)-methylase SpoU
MEEEIEQRVTKDAALAVQTLARVRRAETLILPPSNGDIADLLRNPHPTDLVALVRRPCVPKGAAGLLNAISPATGRSSSSLILCLERLSQAQNVGSVFRSAAAYGASGVLLDPSCADPLLRKAVRGSMASVLRIPFARSESNQTWRDDLLALRWAGYVVVALTLSERAVRGMPSFEPGMKVALLLGNEGIGVSAAAAAASDYEVQLPMSGAIDSLSVGVAAGIALAQCAETLGLCS